MSLELGALQAELLTAGLKKFDLPMLQQTSLFAYEELRTPSKKLIGKRFAVYSVIFNNHSICNQDIAEILHWPINCVTGRTRELVKEGFVEESKKAVHPKTSRLVIYWRIK